MGLGTESLINSLLLKVGRWKDTNQAQARTAFPFRKLFRQAGLPKVRATHGTPSNTTQRQGLDNQMHHRAHTFYMTTRGRLGMVDNRVSAHPAEVIPTQSEATCNIF